MNNNITQIPPESMNLEEKIQRAVDVSDTLNSWNIREAVTHSGERYKHDLATGTQYVAAEGVCIALRENTVAVIMQRPGASKKGTLDETEHLNQSLQGALIGNAQSTVSRLRAKP